MAALAIKGHATRGEEVIEILEMLGGVNILNHTGDLNYDFYKIVGSNIVVAPNLNEKCILFTLEQFLEKFPYKVGDKVVYNNEPMTITKMFWEEHTNTIAYKLNDKLYCNVIEELQPYTEQEEETMEEKKEIFVGLIPTSNGQEIIPRKGYEIKHENGKYYLVKKQPQYPKTYGGCCEVLRINELPYMAYTWNRNEEVEVILQEHQISLLMTLDKFRKLLVCRDAYWKIAGDWKYDVNKTEEYFYIVNKCGRIVKEHYMNFNHILAFPTQEMRDAFYENFKELIEECKELL